MVKKKDSRGNITNLKRDKETKEVNRLLKIETDKVKKYLGKDSLTPGERSFTLKRIWAMVKKKNMTPWEYSKLKSYAKDYDRDYNAKKAIKTKAKLAKKLKEKEKKKRLRERERRSRAAK